MTTDIYVELQARLDSLRKRIAEKRAEALHLFTQLLKEIDNTVGIDTIPDEIKEQLDAIKKSLSINNVQKSITDNEQHEAELTTEDILQAISSLVKPLDAKLLFTAEKLRKELRKIIATRMAIEQSQLAAQLRNVAKAQDFIQLLQINPFKGIVDQFGGADKLFSESMDLAEATCKIGSQLSKVKVDLSQSKINTPMSSKKASELAENAVVRD